MQLAWSQALRKAMRRRDFIKGIAGSAVAWPRVAGAQGQALPVVGALVIDSASFCAQPLDGFHQGLHNMGYFEGRNISIEYRWADSQGERLRALAADLVGHHVTVIFAGGPPAVRAAEAQFPTLPIVFEMGEDPVKEGLIASLSRPGGHITGAVNFQNQLFAKQMGLLQEIAPRATLFGFLVNPSNPNAEPDIKETRAAAEALGLKVLVLETKTERDFEPAFATMDEQRVGGMLVGMDSLFFDRREKFLALVSIHAIPAIYIRREYVVAGGLMSYGADVVDTWRQAGVYVGRILKGEEPADLPVVQSSKFEFVINLKTAKALGLSLPTGLLNAADEVIE
jgi:putative tryptophan/tyrosine transport system substrate-binding protein